MKLSIGHLRSFVSLVLESRPTPIDKPAIRRYAAELAESLQEELLTFEEDEEIGDHEVLVESQFNTRDVKTGKDVSFPVFVRSHWDLRDDVVIGAGAGRVDGQFIIELFINGKYSPYRYGHDMRHHLLSDLYSALVHEVTHAADHSYDTSPRPRYLDKEGNVDDRRYFSDPREVRAFMQEAVEESLQRAQSFKGRPEAELWGYVMNGPTLRRLQKQMDRKSLNRVLKAVYVALKEAGHVGQENSA